MPYSRVDCEAEMNQNLIQKIWNVYLLLRIILFCVVALNNLNLFHGKFINYS